MDFTWKNAQRLSEIQTLYQTPQDKVQGWRQYLVDMIKILKCIQCVTDQAAFVAVDELARRNPPIQKKSWQRGPTSARPLGSAVPT